MRFYFYFYHDVLEPNRSARLHPEVRHRQLFVAGGQIGVAMQSVGLDQGIYFGADADLAAGPEGAWVWRCEIVEEGSQERLLAGEGVSSQAVLKKPIDSISLKRGDRWLFRSDKTTMYAGVVVNRHSHDGPGVRCLKTGEMRIDSRETTATYRPGEAWYETGLDDPVIARPSATQPTEFIRMMLLPPQLVGRRSVKFVDPSSDIPLRGRVGRRIYNDTIIEI